MQKIQKKLEKTTQKKTKQEETQNTWQKKTCKKNTKPWARKKHNFLKKNAFDKKPKPCCKKKNTLEQKNRKKCKTPCKNNTCRKLQKPLQKTLCKKKKKLAKTETKSLAQNPSKKKKNKKHLFFLNLGKWKHSEEKTLKKKGNPQGKTQISKKLEKTSEKKKNSAKKFKNKKLEKKFFFLKKILEKTLSEKSRNKRILSKKEKCLWKNSSDKTFEKTHSEKNSKKKKTLWKKSSGKTRRNPLKKQVVGKDLASLKKKRGNFMKENHWFCKKLLFEEKRSLLKKTSLSIEKPPIERKNKNLVFWNRKVVYLKLNFWETFDCARTFWKKNFGKNLKNYEKEKNSETKKNFSPKKFKKHMSEKKKPLKQTFAKKKNTWTSLGWLGSRTRPCAWSRRTLWRSASKCSQKLPRIRTITRSSTNSLASAKNLACTKTPPTEPILLYCWGSKSGDEQISMKEYNDHMKEEQKSIYYIIDENIAVVSYSRVIMKNLVKQCLEMFAEIAEKEGRLQEVLQTDWQVLKTWHPCRLHRPNQDCWTDEVQHIKVWGWTDQLEGIHRPHDWGTERHLLHHLLFSWKNLRNKSLEGTYMVDPVDE